MRPKPELLDKRRKSIRNIRKITRTMELIATARFKKADGSALHAASAAYTERITHLVADLRGHQRPGKCSHPLLEPREKTERAVLLVLSANRGLCGGYNSATCKRGRLGPLCRSLQAIDSAPTLEVSGKQGIAGLQIPWPARLDKTFTHI